MRNGHREEAARLEARLRQMQNNIERKVSFENKICMCTQTCPGLGDAKDDVRLPAPACQGGRSPGGAQKGTHGQYAEAAAKQKWMHRNVTLFMC